MMVHQKRGRFNLKRRKKNFCSEDGRGGQECPYSFDTMSRSQSPSRKRGGGGGGGGAFGRKERWQHRLLDQREKKKFHSSARKKINEDKETKY